ncbi:MAG TPA: GHMP kinase [Cryomorphaceae bacterium]|nr:GHMP kinase [Owenweeksia sp.]MBF99668.1 GHMP kinase [Owenweeksia sp.]HAD96433.1 GHMP kinase [Cryomorphaceae bacterium]HBF18680.1 GHMP kinase [Cryomorphaceae bacterium]|tara:strand:- start:586 stop:1569 length:984 start_codon:yes stop_codon:yes gene_type:complete
MIITKTPFRISFVGGGSDLEAFYSQSQGAVLSTSINKYMYVSSHRFFEEDKIRTKYSQTETVDHLNELKHPILKECLRKFSIEGGIEISSIADIPSGTGMGSSSSFTVGVLHNLHAFKHQYASKEKLASGACEIEIDLLKEPIGKQDQYAAAYGGLNVIEFNKDGSVNVQPLYIKDQVYQELQDNLCLYYIGNQRSASSILSEQRKNTSQEEKFNTLRKMVDLVYELRDVLMQERLDDFGKLLHENWMMKQRLASGISNPLINELYNTAMENGAMGGKLLGAGGGGFMLFYCPGSKQKKLDEALKKVKRFDFKFEKQGSQLIYYGHE